MRVTILFAAPCSLKRAAAVKPRSPFRRPTLPLDDRTAAASSWRRRASSGIANVARALVLLASMAVGASGEVRGPATADAPAYVGRQACVPCHEAAAERFAGSHHDRAMQPANAGTVRGNFNNASFTYRDGITSTFSRKDGAYFVRTDGPDGQLHDYRIAHTLGVDPLQSSI